MHGPHHQEQVSLFRKRCNQAACITTGCAAAGSVKRMVILNSRLGNSWNSEAKAPTSAPTSGEQCGSAVPGSTCPSKCQGRFGRAAASTDGRQMSLALLTVVHVTSLSPLSREVRQDACNLHYHGHGAWLPMPTSLAEEIQAPHAIQSRRAVWCYLINVRVVDFCEEADLEDKENVRVTAESQTRWPQRPYPAQRARSQSRVPRGKRSLIWSTVKFHRTESTSAQQWHALIAGRIPLELPLGTLPEEKARA